MNVSTKGRYGLRVMIELACHYGRGPTAVDTIARNQDISGKYIRLLVMGLRTAGLVRTVRGPSGGYELARSPAAITALDVVAALEGTRVPVPCVEDPASCARTGRCAARDVWREVAAAMDGALGRFTLEKLAARQRAAAEEASSYSI